MKYFAAVLSAIGTLIALTSTQACNFFIIDEPKMPRSLIEK